MLACSDFCALVHKGKETRFKGAPAMPVSFVKLTHKARTRHMLTCMEHAPGWQCMCTAYMQGCWLVLCTSAPHRLGTCPACS